MEKYIIFSPLSHIYIYISFKVWCVDGDWVKICDSIRTMHFQKEKEKKIWNKIIWFADDTTCNYFFLIDNGKWLKKGVNS